MSDHDGRGWFPPPARPREVENGLRARTARGDIGEAWWSRRFIDELEEIGVGTRLQRGKHYARRGQVVSLRVDAGMVTSTVQGTRDEPYRVRIGLTPLDKRSWARVEAGLAENAWYAAKLLAGEMPPDIEDVFAAHELNLFPAQAADLAMDCSCPDFQVPCKHLAAVFYLLAEAFDDDPFLILAWRGREREELLGNLAAARSTDDTPAADRAESGGPPLEECLAAFFVPPAAEGPGVAAEGVDEDSTVAGDRSFPAELVEVDIRVRDRPIADLLRPAYRHLHGSDGDPGRGDPLEAGHT